MDCQCQDSFAPPDVTQMLYSLLQEPWNPQGIQNNGTLDIDVCQQPPQCTCPCVQPSPPEEPPCCHRRERLQPMELKKPPKLLSLNLDQCDCCTDARVKSLKRSKKRKGKSKKKKRGSSLGGSGAGSGSRSKSKGKVKTYKKKSSKNKPGNCLHHRPAHNCRTHCKHFWELVNELPTEYADIIRDGNFFYKMYPSIVQFCQHRERELRADLEQNLLEEMRFSRPEFKVPLPNFSEEVEAYKRRRVALFREAQRKKQRQKTIQRLIQAVKEHEAREALEGAPQQKSNFVISQPVTELKKCAPPPPPQEVDDVTMREVEQLRLRSLAVTEEIRKRQEDKEMLMEKIFLQLKNQSTESQNVATTSTGTKKGCEFSDCASINPGEVFAEMEEYDEIVLAPVQIACPRRQRPGKFCDADGVLRIPSHALQPVCESNEQTPPPELTAPRPLSGDENEGDYEDEDDMVDMIEQLEMVEPEVELEEEDDQEVDEPEERHLRFQTKSKREGGASVDSQNKK